MKIPKRIRVGGHWIKVVGVPGIVKLHGKTLLGMADYTHKEILLAGKYKRRKLLPGVQAEVLLHEIIHHIDNMHGGGLTEKQVGWVSGALYAVLKDNKLRF
jgi:hypothetical protein